MIKHIGFIMDGNRRWAKERGLPVFLGHRKGAQTLEAVLDFCLAQGIPYVSLYTFSIENLQRSEGEKHFLYTLLIDEIERVAAQCVEKGVKLRFVGERTLFHPRVLDVCERVEGQTQFGEKMVVSFLFCYGGQQDIVATTKLLAKQVAAGTLKAEQIDDTLFARHSWLGALPPLDLVIRTGNRKRLSNFPLFHAAYSEIFFLETLWPEVTTTELAKILEAFLTTNRTFGK